MLNNCFQIKNMQLFNGYEVFFIMTVWCCLDKAVYVFN